MRELPNSNISVKLHLQKFQKKKSVKEILHCMHGKQVHCALIKTKNIFSNYCKNQRFMVLLKLPY